MDNNEREKCVAEDKADFQNFNYIQQSDQQYTGNKPIEQFKHLLRNMKIEISNFHTFLNRKRKTYEVMLKEKIESIEENKIFYNDYNNFLIKFYHFNSKGNYDSSNNCYKDFSFGLSQDLELNENKSNYYNYSLFKNQNNKRFEENKTNNKSDTKIIGLVN